MIHVYFFKNYILLYHYYEYKGYGLNEPTSGVKAIAGVVQGHK
jgi:hypothetical protein